MVELELEMIALGVDEIEAEEGEIVMYAAYESFAAIQKYLEEAGFAIVSAEFERIPTELKDVTAEQRAVLEKMLEKFEDDEDVQSVYHNMREDEEESEE